MPSRTIACLLLLALFPLGCASDHSQIRTIPISIATDNGGELEVFGDLDSPSRLQLTIGLSNAQIIDNYYFTKGRLVRATTQRFQSTYSDKDGQITFTPQSQNPVYTCNVNLIHDMIVQRSCHGSSENLASDLHDFPNLTLVNKLLNGTHASQIPLDLNIE
jgi:hypothetical protein